MKARIDGCRRFVCLLVRKKTKTKTKNVTFYRFLMWGLVLVSQAERENDTLLRAQTKKEDQSLATAIESFQRELQTDLNALKASGGPYKVLTVVVAASGLYEGRGGEEGGVTNVYRPVVVQGTIYY